MEGGERSVAKWLLWLWSLSPTKIRLVFFAVLYSLLQGANFCQLLAKGGSGLFSWFNLSFSLHKLWQGILRAEVAAICLCVLIMSLTLYGSNTKAPGSSSVRHHAVYICGDTNFQIKFVVILYRLHLACIYVDPQQLGHKRFIKFILKACSSSSGLLVLELVLAVCGISLL